MLPSRLYLNNYRSFYKEHNLPLRPVTLLFGHNNSGKSACLRSLSLIGDSLGSKELSPMDLNSPALRGAGFHDLRSGLLSQTDNPAVGLGLGWDNHRIQKVVWYFDYEDGLTRIITKKLQVEEAGKKSKIWQWSPQGDVDRFAQELHYECLATREKIRIKFEGLMPVDIEGSEEEKEVFEDIKKLLIPLSAKVQWVQSVRSAPERFARRPGAPPKALRHDGSNVVDILFTDPDIRRSVSGWYEKHLKRSLRVIPDGDKLKTTLSPKHAGFDIDIVDNGEGTIQILPILTAIELMRHRGKEGPNVLALEEPESHLHPELQRALAEYLCSVSKKLIEQQIVIETHSKHVLLGVRLAVAKGTISPEDVIIHWFQQSRDGSSFLNTIKLDEYGHFQGHWPPGVFSDEVDMARELIKCQRAAGRIT